MDACPKCGAALGDGAACPRCGLAVAHWAMYTAAADAPGADVAAATLFAACEEDWSDAARHDRFMAYCSAASAIGQAAARYRRASVDPARRDVARARLEEIRRLAEQALAERPPAPPPRTRNAKVLVMAAVVFIAALIALLAISDRILSAR
jgi:hypothetical protein